MSVMAKGQQKTNKETKKPKKSTDAGKIVLSSDPVRPTVVTSILPKGKEKKKQQ
jgi:hypothetical protein